MTKTNITDPVGRLRSLRSDEKFNEFIDAYAPDGVYTINEWADMTVGIFGLKSWIQPVVANYIGTGQIDASLADEPVQIESSGAKNLGDTKLVLAPDITQPELKDFINRKWSELIKPHLYDLPYEKHRAPLNTQRNENIYRDYINRKSLVLNIDGIAFRYNISTSTVDRIIASKKKPLY